VIMKVESIAKQQASGFFHDYSTTFLNVHAAGEIKVARQRMGSIEAQRNGLPYKNPNIKIEK
jgi:hypothetical protein